MNQFKAGDKIRREIDGAEDVVVSVPGMSDYDRHDFAGAEEGFLTKSHSWEFQEDWQLIESGDVAKENNTTKRFILRYMMDEDPFEFFPDEKSMIARVKELITYSTVKQDSYKWYEIARQGTVELQPRLLGLGTKTVLKETAKRKRGRPRKVK
jgi:hypothetical protein